MEKNEEWNNFIQRVTEVSSLVKDMASGDKKRSAAAKVLADKYLEEKDLIIREGEELVMKIKSDRTVINKSVFESMEKADTGEIDKEVWMKEVSKDAEKRALDRKIRREKADTFKTQAMKAFYRGDYERARSCYNRALEQVRDNSMLYCDRALTNIKLKNYQKVFSDAENALRLNENSFKARLYKAKAHLQLEELDKYEECKKELDAMFPQHNDLIQYFLTKTEDEEQNEKQNNEEDETTIII